MTLEFVDILDYNGTNPQTFHQLTASAWSAISSSPIFAIFTGLLAILAITRILSGQQSDNPSSSNGFKIPPSVPYWFPYLGHIPNIAYDAQTFFRNLRETYRDGICAVHLFGARHVIVYTPGLIEALLNQPRSNADSKKVKRRLLVHIFGLPKREIERYDNALDKIDAFDEKYLSGPASDAMITQTAQRIRSHATNLVSFNSSPVDQMLWEKTAHARVRHDTKGKQVVEASLLPLIRNFCASSAIETIMGSDFPANHPEFFDDLWIMNDAFLLLATGLPRWVPVPMLTQAHIARKRNLERLDEFHEVIETWAKGEDPGPKWSSLDDVGELIKARLPLYREHEITVRVRAAMDNALAWATTMASTLVFWMVNHIFEDRVLLAVVREEIAPYIKVEQPKSELPISEPPHITHFVIQDLCSNCPLLKSIYLECVRLHTAAWSIRSVQQNFSLQNHEMGGQRWSLRKGEFVHAAHELHHADPNYFENPMVFQADRHMKNGDKKGGKVDMDSIYPFGDGSRRGGSAFRETIIATAAIVAMWEIEPVGGGPWKMPRHKNASTVHSSRDRVQVWVKRRALPQVD